VQTRQTGQGPGERVPKASDFGKLGNLCREPCREAPPGEPGGVAVSNLSAPALADTPGIRLTPYEELTGTGPR